MINFDDMHEDVAASKSSKTEKYPCQSCNGTGEYQGARVHQEKSHCFACKGAGFFKTDPRKREQAKKTRQTKKTDSIVVAMNDLETKVPGALRFVAEAATWSPFMNSISLQVQSGKALSEKQIAAVASAMEKKAARDKARLEEKAKNVLSVDLSPIMNMFETAVEKGHSKPSYRAEGLSLSLAPSNGANAGAIYVKENGAYVGKIVANVFKPVYGVKAEDLKAGLNAIAADPKGAAIAYGKKTGICSCCGRKLTKKISIEAGIGPICAETMGF